MDKAYAVKVFVKPETINGVIYKGKSHKGIVVASNPSDAKGLVVEQFLQAYKTSPAQITKEHIHIKSCELFNDFAFKIVKQL